MARRRKLKITERKLGREKAYGQCWKGDYLIEMDERLRAKHYLSVLVHELLHHVFPWMSETMVTRAAPKIAKGIWQQQYRRLAKCKRRRRLVQK